MFSALNAEISLHFPIHREMYIAATTQRDRIIDMSRREPHDAEICYYKPWKTKGLLN